MSSTVSLKDQFGIQDSGDDQTDKLKAAFAAYAGVAGTGGVRLVLDGGQYVISDMLPIGHADGGANASVSFINIDCPAGPDSTRFLYTGPNDKLAAILFAHNSAFEVTGGFSVRNANASGQGKGTIVGVGFGGSGGGQQLGNQTANFHIESLGISNFNRGVVCGINWGSASEGKFDRLTLFGCDVGMAFDDYNTLDFDISMLSMGSNKVGLKTGACSGALRISSGSASNNDVDFYADSDARVFLIENYRSEGARLFLQGSGSGSPTLYGCLVSDSAGIDGVFDSLTVKESFIPGGINVRNIPSRLWLENNWIGGQWTDVQVIGGKIIKIPLIFDSEGNQRGTKAFIACNRDYNWPPLINCTVDGTLWFPQVVNIDNAGLPSRFLRQDGVSLPSVPKRKVTVSNSEQTGNLSGGIFRSSDLWQPIVIPGHGNEGQTDWTGTVVKVVDAAHIVAVPYDQQGPDLAKGSFPAFIGT